MGVQATIILWTDQKEPPEDALDAAFRRIAELEQVMSDYRDDSEAMVLCADATARPERPLPVSDDLRDVLERSFYYSDASDGAFDPTCGPLVQLWRAARKDHALPDPRLLAEARRSTGWRHVRLQDGRATLEPGMRLDFGGIGKGYAADEALDVLRDHGLDVALVDLGGDMAIGAPPPGRDAWRIEIELRGESRPLLHLANVGVATSGDLYQFVEIDGVRYSHIIDPRTGHALRTPTVACVVAPDATAADALASAAAVLGAEVEPIVLKERAAALVERQTPKDPVRWTFGSWNDLLDDPE